MKHSKHILNTGLLGVFLHPVIYVIYFTIPPDVITYTFLSSLMMGMIFSFPAFIISALLFRFLVKQDWSLWVKYLMLVSGAASGVFKVAIVFAALTPPVSTSISYWSYVSPELFPQRFRHCLCIKN